MNCLFLLFVLLNLNIRFFAVVRIRIEKCNQSDRDKLENVSIMYEYISSDLSDYTWDEIYIDHCK